MRNVGDGSPVLHSQNVENRPLVPRRKVRRRNRRDGDLYERRNYLSDRKDPTLPKGTVRREKVCNAEIWAECFGRNPADMKPTDSYAIAALMMQVEGWERTGERKGVPLYGLQRQYTRKPAGRDTADEQMPEYLE